MPKICSVCRKSDMLCGGCHKLLEEGKISKIDIELSRAFEKIGLSAEFSRTFDHRGRVVIIAGSDSGRIIGKAGKNAKELSKMIGKEIDIIEEGDERKMIEKMLRVPTLGINRVYGKEEKYKVRVERRFQRRAITDPSLMGKVMNKPVEIIFE